MERIFKRVREELKKTELFMVMFYVILSVCVIKALSLFETNYQPNTQVYITQSMYNDLIMLIIGILVLIVIGYVFVTKIYFMYKKLEKSDKEKDALIQYIISKQDENELIQLSEHHEIKSLILNNRKIYLKANKNKD